MPKRYYILPALIICIASSILACKKNVTPEARSTTDNSIAKKLEGKYVEYAHKTGFGKPHCGPNEYNTKEVTIVKGNDTMVFVLNSYVADTMPIHIMSDSTVWVINSPGKLSSDLQKISDIAILASGSPCGTKTEITLEKKP